MQRQASIVLVAMQYLCKPSDSLTRVDDKYTAREAAIWEHYGKVALNTLIWDPVDWWADIALRRVGVHIQPCQHQLRVHQDTSYLLVMCVLMVVSFECQCV